MDSQQLRQQLRIQTSEISSIPQILTHGQDCTRTIRAAAEEFAQEAERTKKYWDQFQSSYNFFYHDHRNYQRDMNDAHQTNTALKTELDVLRSTNANFTAKLKETQEKNAELTAEIKRSLWDKKMRDQNILELEAQLSEAIQRKKFRARSTELTKTGSEVNQDDWERVDQTVASQLPDTGFDDLGSKHGAG